MKKVIRWIFSVLGYGGYTLAVLLFLLWFLFPTESFRVWVQSQLENKYPSLIWDVKDLRLAWPFSIVVVDIRAAEDKIDKPLISVEEVKLRPDLKEILDMKDKYSISYRIKSLNGTASGNLSVPRDGGVVDCSGQIKDMQVGTLEEVWKKIGRNVKGKMSGPFSFKGKWQNLSYGQFQADLVLENGSIDLLQPIMGLEKLDYNQLKSSLSAKDRVVTLAGGKIESGLFIIDFSGNVTLNDNLFVSDLDINGLFEPRPELLGNLRDASVVKLVRDQLRDNKLSFRVTDTMMSPGISFQGVSGVIDGIIQGGGR